MSPAETEDLKSKIKLIVAEKNWEGCEGLELTDVVFPKAFRRQTATGFVMDETHRAGEAWLDGPIVLSWKDALKGGRNEDDGQNLVIHEFAHALDGLDGEMGGIVMFVDSDTNQRWSEVIDLEFAALTKAKETGTRTLLDHYGATNKAEFFAVSSETFFEQPRKLNDQHKELFQLLLEYYKVDPRNWQKS